MSGHRTRIEALLEQVESATAEMSQLKLQEQREGRNTQWIDDRLGQAFGAANAAGIQAFSIIHALCRLAMMNDVEGIRMHQVRRLQSHLAAQGALEQARSLEKLIEAQESPRGRPIRLVPSSVEGTSSSEAKNKGSFMSIREWSVLVENPHRIGCIGSVNAEDEDAARDAAMAQFGATGARADGNQRNAIYEDDDFSVHAV